MGVIKSQSCNNNSDDNQRTHGIVVKALVSKSRDQRIESLVAQKFSNFPKKIEIRTNMITGISRVQQRVQPLRVGRRETKNKHLVCIHCFAGFK